MSFQASPGVRKAMPVLVALYGASGSGKTFSALRLAAGFERITKKPTYVIDTEGGRGLHYADDFKFMHVPFEPPFTSERYVEAVDYCIAQGAGQIVVDSGSHEWEGEGGVLQRQYDTALRMAHGEEKRREAMNMPAWQAVKKPHNALRIALSRSTVHQIWCFRAKEKNTIGKDSAGRQKITNIGFMPVGGTDLIFEFTMSGLLLPGSKGVPTWASDLSGEEIVIKVPKQFAKLTADLKGPLSEDMGAALATWGAAGKSAAAQPESWKPGSFHKEWANEWAGKPIVGAPLEVITLYIATLEERGRKPSADLEGYYNDLVAVEFDRAKGAT